MEAIAELLGEHALASLAPPRLLPPDIEVSDDQHARIHAHQLEISYGDGAQVAELDREIQAAGYDLERRAAAQTRHDEFVKQVHADEAERREDALGRLRRRRGRGT